MLTVVKGTSVTATWAAVKVGSTLHTALVGGDTLTVTVYSPAGAVLSGPTTATGDGAGNYEVTFTAPASPGVYYAEWNATLSGAIGRQDIAFTVVDWGP